MFGEHYPDPVRVISVGKPVDTLLADPKAPDNSNYSVEFCGGTYVIVGNSRMFLHFHTMFSMTHRHVLNSGDIGSFVITSEESIAEGVRRVLALTGVAALEVRPC